MGFVSKSVERILFQKLVKAFSKLITAIRQGQGFIDGDYRVTRAVRDFVNSKDFTDYVSNSIGRMVHVVRIASAKELQGEVVKTTGGHELYRMIQNELNGQLGTIVNRIIAENTAFVKTMPEEWAKYASKYVFDETMNGRRPDEIEMELRKKLPEHIKTNLRLFARTEAAKANAALTQARAEMCGIKAYIWRSVSDERTRPAHAGMDGVLVFYNDPPSPEELFGGKSYGKYHAGNTFNCRCWQQPVVDIRFLPNVVRVYKNGAIRTMGKNQLVQRYGNVA